MSAIDAQEDLPVLRLTRLLPASPERVFDAWTDPESVAVWMCAGTTIGATADLDVRVGGRFTVVMRGTENDHVHSGEYREIRRPDRLVFTWTSSGTEGKETLVSIDFVARGQGTELRLTQELLPSRDAADNHRRGWNSIFDKLAAHLEVPARP
ncbi:MAG: SRPBCC domain-containing protein [Minwuiales bacterium]|nr:SRPBCC domain-containing protein [Minwuiales bacterium]